MIKLKKILIYLLLLLSGLSFQAWAEANINKLELSLGDLTLKPGMAIKLKALALKASPELAINKISLLAIEVQAKSQQGKGMIRLRVGQKLAEWVKVGGSQKQFENKESASFSAIKIRSPDEGKGQAWQLLVNGYMKIRMITLYTTTTAPVNGGSI